MESIYKELIQDSEIGYAAHEVICDEDDIPYDYKCIAVNKIFEEYTGLKAEELIGKKLNILFPELLEDGIDWVKYYGRIAIDGEKIEYEKYSKHSDKWYQIEAYSPKKYYFITSFKDITQLKKISNNLTSSQNILKQVMDTIPSRIFWKDKNFKYLGCNENCAKYMGRSIEEIVGKNDYEIGWIGIKPSDLFREDDKYVIETGQSKLDFEEKIMSSSGETKWVKTSKMALYDGDNRIYGLLGISDDITEQKKLERVLRMDELRHQQLAKKSKSVAWEVDKDGLFTYISPVAEELFGYSPEEIVGKMHVYSAFDIDDTADHKELVLEVIENKESVDGVENKYKNKNNEDVWVLANGFPVLDENGELLFYRGIYLDITYLKKIEEEMRNLSFHDQLTGLYNRRFFEEELKRLDTERNLPLTIVMMDVDGLKIVNDTFGHDVGDLLLKKVADILKQECRADDIIGRIGGDEFVILLPKTSLEQAKTIVDRIYTEIRKQRIEAVNISISYGCNTKSEINEKIEDVFRIADIKMYDWKTKKKTKLRRETIENIMKRLFERSSDEKSHSKNVSELSSSIGEALDLDDIEIENLKIIGMFHDIGKIVIPKEILIKKNKLNEEELIEMKRHPGASYSILSYSDTYSDFAKIVLHHHERYDGGGYPKGLKGEDIPLNSRILALADSYDAMTNYRYGRKGMSKTQAIDIIKEESGKQFDPKVVEAFLKLM